MCPPWSVNLQALFSRLPTTCASRVGSASRWIGCGGSVDRQLVVHAAVERRGPPRRPGATTGSELDALAAQLDPAARDAADVEQIVDQARHVADLALEHLGRRAERSVAVAAAADRRTQHLHRVADRRQRIAELVRQRGQELVLAAVGLGEVAGELLVSAMSSRSRSIARRCSLMSRTIFDAPTTLPSASRIGEMVSETCKRLPSDRTRSVSK